MGLYAGVCVPVFLFLLGCASRGRGEARVAARLSLCPAATLFVFFIHKIDAAREAPESPRVNKTSQRVRSANKEGRAARPRPAPPHARRGRQRERESRRARAVAAVDALSAAPRPAGPRRPCPRTWPRPPTTPARAVRMCMLFRVERNGADASPWPQGVRVHATWLFHFSFFSASNVSRFLPRHAHRVWQPCTARPTC